MSRALAFLFMTFFIFCHAAFADETRNEQATKLVGWWEEYSPSSNFIQFSQDGTVKVMLKRGEIGDLRSLNGTWTILEDRVLHIKFSANGETFTRDAKLSFKNDEMILTDTDGTETRHRRHSGILPKEYVW